MFIGLCVKFLYWICGGLMFLRYLESFNVPGTVKRKCGSSSYTSSSSNDDKQREETGETEGE